MSTEKTENKMILRDYLAVDRTKLANQRTLLSMVRTGLYFAVMGLTVLTLETLEDIRPYFWVLFAFSIGFITIGIANYFKMDKKIEASYRDAK